MKARVLIVDDQKDNLYLLETLLRGCDYQVVSAENGLEALEKMRAEPMDLVISDILMPVLDGFQLCRECKADPGLRNVPFIFYTATYTDDQDEKLALALGADDYVRKPVEPDRIVAIVRGIVEKGAKRNRDAVKKPPAAQEQEHVLGLYNQRLVEKLENKTLALERSQKELRETTAKLRAQKKELERKNVALREVLAQIEAEKDETKRQISANVDRTIMPLVSKLRAQAGSHDLRRLELLERSLSEIASRFGIAMARGTAGLTPRQIELCNMIKSGLTSKEISDLLHISLRTVETHRSIIRRKLGLAHSDTNLATHLNSLA